MRREGPQKYAEEVVARVYLFLNLSPIKIPRDEATQTNNPTRQGLIPHGVSSRHAGVLGRPMGHIPGASCCESGSRVGVNHWGHRGAKGARTGGPCQGEKGAPD